MFYVLLIINFLVVFSLELTKNIAINTNGEAFNIIVRRKFVPSLHHSGRRSQQDGALRLLRKTKDIVNERRSRRQVRILKWLSQPI